MKNNILVINPGTTSTKVAVFEDEKPLFSVNVPVDMEKVKEFDWCMDQVEYRKEVVIKTLEEHGVDIKSITAIAARGGMLPPCSPGAYVVDQAMVDYVYSIRKGAHISNAACVIAYQLASNLSITAYVYDPVGVDELTDIARISGMPEIPREVMGHTLNTRAMAMKCCSEMLKKPFDKSTIIIVHMGGGGISTRILHNGRNIDAYNDDNGAMSSERAGAVSAIRLIELCFSGKYTERELIKKIRGQGGVKAHIGISDAKEIEKRIESGDAKAKLVYDAMAYAVSKDIASLAAVVSGKVDCIILTGGMARSEYIDSFIEERVSFIAPFINMAGEIEMEALAAGILRVQRKEEGFQSIDKFIKKKHERNVKE